MEGESEPSDKALLPRLGDSESLRRGTGRGVLISTLSFSPPGELTLKQFVDISLEEFLLNKERPPELVFERRYEQESTSMGRSSTSLIIVLSKSDMRLFKHGVSSVMGLHRIALLHGEELRCATGKKAPQLAFRNPTSNTFFFCTTRSFVFRGPPLPWAGER